MSEIIKKSMFVEAYTYYKPVFFLKETSSYYPFRSHIHYTHAEGKINDPVLSTKVIKTIDVPSPLLSVGDLFYFEDTEQIVKIDKVMRTSEDNVVYVIATKAVPDEEAQKQYEKDKATYLNLEQMKNKIDNLENELEKTNIINRRLLERGLLKRIINK